MSFTAPPPGTGTTAWIEALPNVRVPTILARLFSRSAAATISAALAVARSTTTTSGMRGSADCVRLHDFAERVRARVRDDAAALEEDVDRVDGLGDQAARVAAQVEHDDRRAARRPAHVRAPRRREKRVMRITRTAPLATSCDAHGGLRDDAAAHGDDRASRPALRCMIRSSGPRWGACSAASAVSRWPRTRSPSTASSASPCASPARAAGERGTTPTMRSARALRAHAHADAVEALASCRPCSAAYCAEVR